MWWWIQFTTKAALTTSSSSSSRCVPRHERQRRSRWRRKLPEPLDGVPADGGTDAAGVAGVKGAAGAAKDGMVS